MKIIIWDLPGKEIAYLKKNCEKQFETGEICVMAPENANGIYEKLNSGELSVQEVLIVSENCDILAESANAGMITIAYIPPVDLTTEANTTKNVELERNTEEYEAGTGANGGSTGEVASSQEFPQVDIIVEGFEEVDYDFFEKIYQRHHNLPWTILETEHLIVRELMLSDIDALFELYSYEGMTDYMEGLYPYEEEYEYQKAYIENMYRFFGYGMWLVFEKETGRLVGRAGVEHREELEGELELGYAIGTPWQGKGYATEVCKGILVYVREELGFEEICSLVEYKNTASVHLLEKLGFVLEKELILEEINYKKYKKSLEIG
ncbi:MAG: GNAT family N-acetyltransferase [Roseburia sp.]|nr:GNAT family N-acetyltransferase [Roseburia sp.]